MLILTILRVAGQAVGHAWPIGLLKELLLTWCRIPVQCDRMLSSCQKVVPLSSLMCTVLGEWILDSGLWDVVLLKGLRSGFI